MAKEIVYSSATTAGIEHKRPHGPGSINNQDAVLATEKDGVLVSVACDGCGSKPHSEIGAQFGVSEVSKAIFKEMEHCQNPEKVNWELITEHVVKTISEVAHFYQSPGETLEKVIADRFLFTVVCMIIKNGTAVIAACGDGLIILDDEVHEIKPPIENTPPYLAYRIIPSEKYNDPELTKLKVVKKISIADIKKTLAIGTDGLGYLSKRSDLHHPALLTEPENLPTWLKSKVHNQSEIYVPDDVAITIVRPQKVQDTLIRKYTDMGRLQSQIAKLTKDLDEALFNLERVSCERDRVRKELIKERARIRIFPTVAPFTADLNRPGAYIRQTHPASNQPADGVKIRVSGPKKAKAKKGG